MAARPSAPVRNTDNTCASTFLTSIDSDSNADDKGDTGCLGKGGDGLLLSATYLTATFGGTPAHYSLRLGQPCSSTVVVHLLFIADSFRSMRVSSDRICFTPENYSEPQIVRVEVLNAHSHSNAISHRVYSLDKNYDRIVTPSVVVTTEWTGTSSLLTFGGPMSKRRAAAVGSTLTAVDIRHAIPTLPPLSRSRDTDASGDDSDNSSGGRALVQALASNTSATNSCSNSAEQQQRQDSPWFVSQLASGHNFSLAVVTHHTTMLFAWGSNANGELGLGLGSTTSIADPQLVTALPLQVHSELVSVLSVSCGRNHAALVTSQAKLFTWGSNKHGQLGHGDYTNRLEPHEVHFALATLSSNQRALRLKHTILGRGGTNVTQTACGAAHTLFVTHQQNVLAMGYNQAGQLGIGHRLQQHKRWRSCVPIAVEALRDRSILDVAAGQHHSACVLSNGAVYVWGCGDDGRLGIGPHDCVMVPALVSSLWESGVRARTVRCGARHTAVVSDHDVLYVWGANEFGQLGCGDKKARFKPCVLCPPTFVLEGVADVALGEFHSVALTRRRGKAFVWGLDLSSASAQLDQRSLPIALQLPQGQHAQRVSCGWSHTNIVAQTGSSYDDDADAVAGTLHASESLSPSSVRVDALHPTSTSFQRTVERKQLALRREELAAWRAFAGAWGHSSSDRSPVAWKRSRPATAVNRLAAARQTSANASMDRVPVEQGTASQRVDSDGLMCQRVAIAFVHAILQRSVDRLSRPRDASKVDRRLRPQRCAHAVVFSLSLSILSRQDLAGATSGVPHTNYEIHSASAIAHTQRRELPTLSIAPTPRGIFYQNALQPPPLPPSSTIALERLATTYHHHHHNQQQHNSSRDSTAVQSASLSAESSSVTIVTTPRSYATMHCPTRPQSCARTRPHASTWSPREHRPHDSATVNAIRDDARDERQLRHARDASSARTSRSSALSPRATNKSVRPATAAAEYKQGCCPSVRSPRAAAKSSLGVMETLMHKPSYSIAQAVLVVPAIRTSVMQVRQHSPRQARQTVERGDNTT